MKETQLNEAGQHRLEEVTQKSPVSHLPEPEKRPHNFTATDIGGVLQRSQLLTPQTKPR